MPSMSLVFSPFVGSSLTRNSFVPYLDSDTVPEMPNLGELEKTAWHYATGYPGFEINFFFKGPTGD